MAKDNIEKSFRIKCVPGRPLMWKKPPTKRTFTFHLPKFEKNKKNTSNKENINTSKRSDTRTKIIGQKENSLRQARNASYLSQNISQKSINKSKTNLIKYAAVSVKHKLVTLKDSSNIIKVPISASKPCEQYETPFLPLMPLASLQKRLVDTYGSFSQRKSSETSQSTLLTDSISTLTVPNLIIPNKSNLSIHDSNNNISRFVEQESNNLQKTTSEIMIIPENLSNIESFRKDRLSKSFIRDRLPKSLIKDRLSKSLIADIESPNDAQFGLKSRKSLFPINMNQIEISCEKDKIIKETNEFNSSVLSSNKHISGCDSPCVIIDCDKTAFSNELNEQSIADIPSTDEKILNTPLHNNLSHAKRRKVVLQKNNINPSITSKEKIIHTSSESLNSDILIISPLNAINNRKDLVPYQQNEDYIEENLHLHNKNLTKHIGNKIELDRLQRVQSSNFVTVGTKRKYNYFEDSTNTSKNSSYVMKQGPEVNISEKSTEEGNKSHKGHLSSELVTKFAKRFMKKSFNYNVLQNESLNMAQLLNVKKPRQKPVSKPVLPDVELPETVKALLWKKTSLKRKVSDVTDLEIALHIFAQNCYSMRDPITDVNVYQILKAYEHAVTKDITKIVSQTVELQKKHKEISKLYKKLNQKGKKLGNLVDERHKLRHEMVTGQIHRKE